MQPMCPLPRHAREDGLHASPMRIAALQGLCPAALHARCAGGHQGLTFLDMAWGTIVSGVSAGLGELLPDYLNK